MRLADVTNLCVPRACVAEVHVHMRRVGREGSEGLGLWVGRQEGARFDVTHALIPAQRHIRTSDGICVITDADELHRINVWLYRERLTLIAQIHSHPGRAYHSDTDDAYAITTTVGCFSVVVPDFATAPFDLAGVAAYRLDARGVWKGLSAAQVRHTISITD